MKRKTKKVSKEMKQRKERVQRARECIAAEEKRIEENKKLNAHAEEYLKYQVDRFNHSLSHDGPKVRYCIGNGYHLDLDTLSRTPETSWDALIARMNPRHPIIGYFRSNAGKRTLRAAKINAFKLDGYDVRQIFIANYPLELK